MTRRGTVLPARLRALDGIGLKLHAWFSSDVVCPSNPGRWSPFPHPTPTAAPHIFGTSIKPHRRLGWRLPGPHDAAKRKRVAGRGVVHTAGGAFCRLSGRLSLHSCGLWRRLARLKGSIRVSTGPECRCGLRSAMQKTESTLFSVLALPMRHEALGGAQFRFCMHSLQILFQGSCCGVVLHATACMRNFWRNSGCFRPAQPQPTRPLVLWVESRRLNFISVWWTTGGVVYITCNSCAPRSPLPEWPRVRLNLRWLFGVLCVEPLERSSV